MRVRTETTSYVFDLDDVDAYVRFDSASAVTATVPDNVQIPFSVGDTIDVMQAGAGALTIAALNATINKANTLVLAKQNTGGTLVKVAANAWDFHGYTTSVLAAFADDAAAETGGVPVGGLYRTASAVKVRVA